MTIVIMAPYAWQLSYLQLEGGRITRRTLHNQCQKCRDSLGISTAATRMLGVLAHRRAEDT